MRRPIHLQRAADRSAIDGSYGLQGQTTTTAAREPTGRRARARATDAAQAVHSSRSMPLHRKQVMRWIARARWFWPSLAAVGLAGSLIGIGAFRRWMRGRVAGMPMAGESLPGDANATGTMVPPSGHLPPDARMGIKPDERVDEQAAKNVGHDPPGWLP
jgi:hypothetical protein